MDKEEEGRGMDKEEEVREPEKLEANKLTISRRRSGSI